jgi:Zn-finger protein
MRLNRCLKSWAYTRPMSSCKCLEQDFCTHRSQRGLQSVAVRLLLRNNGARMTFYVKCPVSFCTDRSKNGKRYNTQEEGEKVESCFAIHLTRSLTAVKTHLIVTHKQSLQLTHLQRFKLGEEISKLAVKPPKPHTPTVFSTFNSEIQH